MKHSRGLTLIELLVTVALVALISMTLYSSLASGINIAQRITRPFSDEDLAVFFEKMSREISNAFPYSEIPFQGTESYFSVSTTIRSEDQFGGDLSVGRVTYEYQSSLNTLNRRQENISEVFKEEQEKPVPVLKDATSISFKYYGLEPSAKIYHWFREWDSVEHDGKLPLAIRIEMEFQDEGKKRELLRTFTIPTGG